MKVTKCQYNGIMNKIQDRMTFINVYFLNRQSILYIKTKAFILSCSPKTQNFEEHSGSKNERERESRSIESKKKKFQIDSNNLRTMV